MSHHPETNPYFHSQPPHDITFHPQPPPQRRPKNQRPLPINTPTPHFPIHEQPHHPHPSPIPTRPGRNFTVEYYPENSAEPPNTPTPQFHSHEEPHHQQPPHHPRTPPHEPHYSHEPLDHPQQLPHHQRYSHEPPDHHQPRQHPQAPFSATTHPTPTRPDRNQQAKHHNREHSPQPTPSSLRVPSPHKTSPHTWLIGACCALFWLAIILGGLIILVVYVVFRPRGPKFDISNASLNAAYLDMGYLLNADITILANFTNPSKKATVDFSHIELYLYYEKTLIASSYVNPFSALKADSRFRDIHLVSSQVWLPSRERQRLRQQIENNRVLFEVKVLLRTRSNLGTIFRYSYRLYGHCIIEVTGPPSGILVAKQCKTKR